MKYQSKETWFMTIQMIYHYGDGPPQEGAIVMKNFVELKYELLEDYLSSADVSSLTSTFTKLIKHLTECVLY